MNTIRMTGKEPNPETSIPKTTCQPSKPIHQIKSNKLNKITFINASTHKKTNTSNMIPMTHSQLTNKNIACIPNKIPKSHFQQKKKIQ